MATIYIDPASVFNGPFLPFIKAAPETRKPLIILEGGRGSGKSRAVAQHLILRAIKKKLRFALVRKVAETVRDSQYKEIRDTVEQWGLEEYFEFIASPLSIRVSNGSEFITKGMDKAPKIKSLANVDVIWIEEATELRQDDYLTLALTIRGRGAGGMKQRILSFNRIEGSWIERLFFEADGSYREQEGIYHSHTTFLCNKFLDRPFIEQLEGLRESDIDLYRKNALGLPVHLKGLIYPVWDVSEIPPDLVPTYGLDFGYNPDPCVCAGVYFRGQDMWIDEVVYQTNLLNNEFIRLVDEQIPAGVFDFYGDSAEPDRIEEFYRFKRSGGSRFNIFKVDKGKNSLADGIDAMKRYRIHVTPRSLNIQRELQCYKWKTDKNGLLIDREPLDKFNHALDAARYVTWMREKSLAHSATLEDFQDVRFEELSSVAISRMF